MSKPNKLDGSTSSGTIDNRDALKPGEWDRRGAGELESDDPSTVGTPPKRGDEHTSAGN